MTDTIGDGLSNIKIETYWNVNTVRSAVKGSTGNGLK